MRRAPRSFVRVLAVPGALAGASFAGLVLALAGDGWRDAVGAALAATPVIAVLWASLARRT